LKILEALRPLVVPIETVREDEDNARHHGTKNQKAITDSLRRFGQQKPIVVNADGVIVAGNGTYRGAQELGAKEIAAATTDLDTLTLQRAYAIADNRTGELAEWNYEGLSKQFEELIADEFDVETLGWTAGEIESLTLADWSPPQKKELPTKEDQEGRRITLTDEQWEQFNRASTVTRSEYGEQLSDAQCLEVICAFFLEHHGADASTETH
jgi:hypothetical protein